MEVDCDRIRRSLRHLREKLDCSEVEPFLRLSKFSSPDMDRLVLVLGQLLENPKYTEGIADGFGSILLLIVANAFGEVEYEDEGKKSYLKTVNREGHRRKCIALSKLVARCPDVLRFSIHYFRSNPPPFGTDETVDYTPSTKQKKAERNAVTELELVQCCYRFLSADPIYFRTAWSWSEFFEQFSNRRGCSRQQYYYNRILALVSCMTQSQVNKLDQELPLEAVVREQLEEDSVAVQDSIVGEEESKKGLKMRWNFRSNVVTNVGDVMLPIFDAVNCDFYRGQEKETDDLVVVDSTRLNVRSLAMGVSSGKAICLSGPVGCGKTSLVEYLARKTGRIAPKTQELERRMKSALKEKSKKRKSGKLEGELDVDMKQLKKEAPRNGFLRIQLGDQTDSKMLLGQYRCTDTPGEFVWQPGVLTQAVMNGYWLLLEDLDSATQDVCTVLTNLLENNYLSVPGFRDCLRIEPGFQLFLTLRTHKSGAGPAHNTYTLLEKYLYTVNVLPLARSELCSIICTNFPRLKTVASRIVDIYLTFSSGCHAIESDEISESISFLEEDHKKPLKGFEQDGEDILPTFQYDNITLGSLPSSGRLVSTRDLIKLCRRSDPSFSVTSTECAYFVFQNAVDIFCSHLPAGEGKRNLIVSIGGKIGINKSRCDHLCEDYKPDVDVSAAEQVKIGRVNLKRNLEGDENDVNDRNFLHKKIRLDKNASTTVKTQDFKLQNKAPTFSFTRPASCLLERIAVSVAQNEPILLVGETGVGKTSSIQYLAYQTHHKLVVVNMNNQSDVSDLIGGFKPVDLSYVITPLRYEFEFLFHKTFNAQKNEKFLTNVSICYNRAEYNVLVKLMLKIAEKVFTRKQDEQLRLEKVYEKWATLQQKLQRLDSQLRNSVNVSFAFIPGSLVNCIRNGDWVLLDEINLASTETLECLSTILEPDGSIILLEKGDFVPVKRHPDFRIFSCMNPNTDVGKKDLPVGIRNRFTEFFVDELVAENDLLILVNDYLCSTGIQKVRILNTVKLYRRLRALSQLELSDGLGNKPVFSLRTLCRALSICSKNLCGSIERNLYESFCLSFLTQLDLKSHKTVLTFIQKTLLNDVTQAISQQIPRPPNGEQLNFEGYWIEKGPKDVQECENYILTESVRNNLRDLARIISIGKLPVLLQGPTSAGKTSLIEYIAKRSGNVCLRINNHEHTDLQEYIGTYMADVTGKLSFKEGVLVEAMRNGFWIILDELNLAPSDILEALNRVLDDNRELFIPETQVVVKAHPNFMLFATQNPPGLYGGRKMLSRAFKNRFVELHFSEIPREELEVILEKRCLIPKSYAQKMVKVMSELQLNRRSTAKQNFTLRDLFRWGNRYTYADKTLLEDTSYDWNQHLIDEGYLVLSSKVRNLYETKIIEEALYTHFRKRVLEEKLFSLKKGTSMVTRGILEQLERQSIYENIVWTFDMRRMAVLTAKALEFNEPVLLVGPTGCGKTTICQILAAIRNRNLRILNCHMHTEGADFLGGLRPFRDSDDSVEKETKQQLFEWADGPLVLSMAEGGFFLADEISLAEDSVLERLNCVLEPERTLLLAEKGGVSADASEFVITAADGFQFLATMNPGGDFGKKELSPALRNRLTEIWCRATESKEDLIRIAEHMLRKGIPNAETDPHQVAQVIISIVFVLKKQVDKLNFSIRDVLAWVAYLCQNQRNLSLAESLIYGLETVFLDSLEMLPYETYEEIVALRQEVLSILHLLIKEHLGIKQFELKRGTSVQSDDTTFGITPFFIDLSLQDRDRHTEFLFSAPTTQKNLFRLLSALSLDKAILLEGPPGVGKTSLVENLARAAGFAIVRINLCEHTDLADLFGTDLPADDRSLEIADDDEGGENQARKDSKLGSFVWRDGPLLAALKAKNTWILLDELNLAPQSVLEGLNAILDHRGEVYIAELNKTFKLGKKTRIFAAQNPLRQGGGRKGLPQSFLNRFTKVYLRKLEREDLLHVVNGKYQEKFQKIGEELTEDLGRRAGESVSYFAALKSTEEEGIVFDLAQKMVVFSETLESGIANLEFGYKGGPFEANLRDILRWCELFCNDHTGYFRKRFSKPEESYYNFLLVLFEKMKLVYYQRMRTDVDKNYILTAFARVFECDAFELELRSQDIGVYWTDDKLYLGDLIVEKIAQTDEMNPLASKAQKSFPLLLASQVETLKNVAECVQLEKPVILCGPGDCGKTKIINLLTTLGNKFCNVDTIDDSVTGSFQQFDFNRHLEEISSNVEAVVMDTVKQAVLSGTGEGRRALVPVMAIWEKYARLNDGKMAFTAQNVQSEELSLFRQRLSALQDVITLLTSLKPSNHDQSHLHSMISVLGVLFNISKHAETLNTGGHFEWVDSKIVKSLKHGQYICLEHVNLCSSAILDRLNPIFEPDGSLLISEKGVDGNNESELIRKHANFRAFLTLDPKNGEISRAMRNRCIELALHKEAYGEDDLKRLVFESGVRDNWLINVILAIHKSVKKVSEFNQFGIAHIVKFAFLVSQNQRMGMAAEKCLMISASEVYVRSSNTDLLGYGLDFYRNALKTAIKDELGAAVVVTPNLVNFENVLLRSNQLTSLQLIKLQAEPLLCILRCHLNNFTGIAGALSDIAIAFNEQDEINLSSLKYLFYFLYETSSFNDVERRKIFLTESLKALQNVQKVEPKKEITPNLDSAITVDLEIQGSEGQWKTTAKDLSGYRDLLHTKREKVELDEVSSVTIDEVLQQLTSLNQVLFAAVAKFGSSEHLPWNRSLLPRIREYLEDSTVEQYLLSAILLLNTTLQEMKAENASKLSKIDVLSYSKAVTKEMINDTVGNKLVAQLYNFLTSFKPLMEQALRNASLDQISYAKLIGSFLWINRLIDLSHRKLFVNKEIDTGLIDYITLHFKWIQKHCMSLLDDLGSSSFKTLNDSLEESIQSSTHPLAMHRKLYSKTFLSSLPFYTEEQVVHYQRVMEFNEGLRLSPRLTRLFDYEEFLKKVALLNHPKTIDLRRSQLAHSEPLLTLRLDQREASASLEQPEYAQLIALIQQFREISAEDSAERLIISTEQLAEYRKFAGAFETPEEYSHKFPIEMQPLYEYFLLKSLSSDSPINYDFVASVRSLNLDTLRLLKYMGSPQHVSTLEMSALLDQLIQSGTDLGGLLKALPSGFYKNITACQHQYRRHVYSFHLNSLAIDHVFCYQNDTEDSYETHLDQPSNHSLHGPVLTSSSLSILLTPSGELRSTGLGELPEWRNTLKMLRNTIWTNSVVLRQQYDQHFVGLDRAVGQARKLLVEYECVQKWAQDSQRTVVESVKFVEDFHLLAEELQKCLQISNELRSNATYAELRSSANRNLQWHLSSALNALCGAIELNLLTYLPLLDPVEKNALKKSYTDEDIQHYRTLIQVYDYMAITMNYRRLGESTKHAFIAHLDHLEDKRRKLCRKVALRPTDNIYSEMVKDVNNFLISCCYPGTIVELIVIATQCLNFEVDTKNPIKNCTQTKNFQLRVNETIKQIELWVNIADKFEHHTLQRYQAHYRDFLEPLCCSIATMKYGLVGLKHCLVIRRDSIGIKSNGVFYDLAEKDALAKIVEKFAQFPVVKPIALFDEEASGHKVNVYSILEKIDHSESGYFRLLKSKLQDVKNAITLRGGIGQEEFVDLDKIVNVCNQVWQKQENLRRKKQAEDDSLYQTKSHCEEKDEEVVAQREIVDLFPNYVDEDFADFIQNDTLEQVIKKDTVRKNQKLVETIAGEDYTLICESFIYLMNKFSKSFYYNPETVAAELPEVIAPDFVGPFQTKIAIFQQILQKYRPALNCKLDESFYPGLSFLVGLAQEKFEDLELKRSTRSKYNFYKDSNIGEVVQCVEVLKKIEDRVRKLLLEWPDHAVLKDILLILNRIYALPSTAPIVRFSTGLQLLRQKIDEWNSVAHRLNNLRELEADIVEFVHRWMRMELQYWRECMSQTHDNVRSKAYRYWFFMYNLLHEYLQSDSKAKLGNLLDYRKVERCFGEQELLDEEEAEEGTVKIEDLIHVLKQFMESSNYAEFTTRLRVLKSFEQYLMYLNFEDNRKKETVIAVLYNLHMYYDQFSAEIEEFIRTKRAPIEKKLKEFVKIESFNKDLSYFSMRNNIARVHRQLHKFLKEFETEIRAKILPVFTPKDPAAEINDAEAQKGINLRSEPKITYYMVDVKNFMASLKLKEKFSVAGLSQETTPNQELLAKIDRFFVTSRTVVKEAILHAPFPSLIYNLDTFLHDQIESIEYLRGLEVDRGQPKPKQKSQAKQILNQKRKSLSDFYKSLTQLGLSFRSGLVENAIESEFVDVTIKPFSVDLLAHNSKYRKVDQHIVYLNDKLNLYYAKSVFKIKMLMKVLLQPNADIGKINLERIKGFAVDLFLAVQNQRKELGKSISSVFELRDRIQDLTQLSKCLESTKREFNFGLYHKKMDNIQTSTIKVQSVLEQFQLLLSCAPAEVHEELRMLKDVPELTQKTLEPVLAAVHDASKRAVQLVEDLKKCNDNYLTADFVQSVDDQFNSLTNILDQLCDQLKIGNSDEYSVYAQPIQDTLKIVRSAIIREEQLPTSDNLLDEANLNNEVENIIHSILIAMQHIYKKYSTPNQPEPAEPTPQPEDTEETEEHEPKLSLQPQHLKEKINVDLLQDLQTLSIRKVVTKIGNLLAMLENANHSAPQLVNMIQKVTRLVPILEQFNLLVEYYLIQQLGAHKISTKMLSVMLTVFIELGTRGFCVPKDLLEDEQEAGGEQQEGNETGEKFGFEDGEGEKDVSNKIESEDQLDDAKKPGQEDKNEEEEKDNKEEKGIDMSEDFDSKLQDVEKPEGDDSEEENEDEEDADKQMGDTEEGAEKLDDQIWGDDEQKEEEKEEDMEEEDGKGSGEADDQHNNLDSEKDKAPGEEEEGLDAVDKAVDDKKKEKPKDIEDMNNEEGEEEQENPHHNELEEPPQPEDMDIDEDFNLDNDDRPDNQKDEEENQENPFDIDNMKDKGDDQDEEEGESKEEDAKDGNKDQQNGDDSSDEDQEQENPDGVDKLDENQENPEGEEEQEKPDDEVQQLPDENKDEQPVEEEPQSEEAEDKKKKQDEQHHESKDKRSEEERIEAMPDTENKGTSDQVANEKPESKQENEMDEQDTGEDKDGIGQAENEKSDSGHQGIAESKETQTKRDKNDQKQQQEKRRQGNTDEDRMLGDPDKAEKKRLKTVDEINREDRANEEDDVEEDADKEEESEEYQHVKDAKQSDKTTLDNATEEQSKKLQHQENKKQDDNPEQEQEGTDELMDVDEQKEELEETDKQLLESEKNEKKKDKPAKKDENQREKVETLENVEVEGETVETARVPRGEDTTAHTIMDILNDMTVPEESSTAEALEMRKMVEKETMAVNAAQPEHEDFDRWQHISNKMLPNARELCEQLRLILEPTKCTRLKGDYRTGRRINMKKIIPYIASQFRKDKIWLRRTKAAQRDYKITIAVDDSKSMDHNNSKDLTLQAISLVSQALTLLESGRLNVMSFGESPKILLKHSDQFDGAKLINSLNFEQNQSRIAEMLDFVRTFNTEDTSSSDNGIFENLLLVLSDGRNIFSEGEKKVKNSVKLARLQRIFIVYVIIDNPENKHSVMDIRVPLFTADRSQIVMQSYLDVFPFPYYVIVRDLGQLPMVLSDAMRQWFELVNSEQ